MVRSLYFKIVLIFVVFMITVMVVVGTVLMSSVFSFYMNDFSQQIDAYLGEETQMTESLRAVLDRQETEGEDAADYARQIDDILAGYSTFMGIDIYRNYYVLDPDGRYLAGSDDVSGENLSVTPNLIAAMKQRTGKTQVFGSSYTDYARYMEGDAHACIIYIKDTQEEMRELIWELFSLILQSVFFGLAISVILAFFLARAITRPIQRLTQSAGRMASGEFNTIEVVSGDEIGTLTETFNDMNTALQDTMNEIEGERSKLKTLFTYLKDGVIAFSDKGHIIQINKAAMDLLEERYSEQLTFSSMMESLSVEFAQAYVSEENGDKSYIIRDVELGSRAVDIHVGMLKYYEGKIAHHGCIVVMHDITSRYELDKSRREFVANVSHELRTPLTFIKGATETILTYPDMGQEKERELLEESLVESDRMLNIIMDLLTLSRLDGKRTQWKVTSFDLKTSVTHLCTTLRMQAEERRQSLLLDCDCPDCLMTGDKDRLEQVIINIISNAIKYTPEEGSVRVTLTAGEEKAQISVRDNGIGIPKEDLPHIFDRFYRVEKSRTSEKGGTGLGLSIAKEIVEAHGGKIKMISAKDKGTEVIILLPRKTSLESTGAS